MWMVCGSKRKKKMRIISVEAFICIGARGRLLECIGSKASCRVCASINTVKENYSRKSGVEKCTSVTTEPQK